MLVVLPHGKQQVFVLGDIVVLFFRQWIHYEVIVNEDGLEARDPSGHKNLQIYILFCLIHLNKEVSDAFKVFIGRPEEKSMNVYFYSTIQDSCSI